jgi:hypothetical protein
MFIEEWSSVARRARGILSALVAGAISAVAMPAVAGDPVKLEVVPSEQAVDVGAPVTLNVFLRGADNAPAAAPKRLEVNFEVGAPIGEANLPAIIFAPGQSKAQVQMEVTSPGVWSVRARNRELLEGGAIIYGKPGGGQSALPPAPIGGTDVAMAVDVGDPRGIGDTLPPASGPAATILLTATPDRRLLADNRDAATILAFVRDGAPDEDIRVQLVASLGTISPNPLIIPKGKFAGQATLTADRVGRSRIRFVAAQPTVVVESDSSLEVDFAPPITQLQLRASPPTVSLLDTPQIVVVLQNAEGQPVETDEPRKISLYLEEGNGEIQPVEVEVPKGKFDGRAEFTPWWMGGTKVVASSSNLLNQATTLTVMLPTLLIALTAAGGLVGGVIAFWTNRTRWWRVVIGLFAGFILYWAMIFGLLQSIPRGVALNPLSAFAVALIGGYIGPQLLAMMARKFGIGATR